MADWKNKRVSILGLGRSGLAAASYLHERGAQVLLSESQPREKVKPDLLSKLSTLNIEVEFGGHTERTVSWPELIITSPGIPPRAEVITRARSLKKEVISDIELAYRETREGGDKPLPFIAVTGTNGKSTTTALISYILEFAGRNAPACGNIGVPIMSLLDGRPLDFLVVEVSSYQLEYSPTFAPFVGVWLNLTPDHVDWHGSLDAYIDAKRSMFKNQSLSDYAVLNMDDSVVASTIYAGEYFPFSVDGECATAIQGAYLQDEFFCANYGSRSRVVCHQSEVRIIGKHNQENCLAAISAGLLAGLNEKEIKAGLTTFTALEHRLEYVATIDGVAYYNDSKATNTDSTIKALESFPNNRVVLIAGGKDKGTSLNELVQVVKKYASSVILIGEAKERFERALRNGGYSEVYPVDSLEEAVTLGGKLNKGPVLLSPACASFDMFKDFEDRGRVFKELVHARTK
ncbi:MAG: UDP-N-acetylmuramoyl-L-alanine--D-glutamate ligase [Candidatus Obscuribacter phosphatis]|uniref:UDP-N-acetylmuramoylalanine--D-glutamate ligase n=1 Tax=Candidatus Obscuribacter phosphatis TaxID=1906157 RepID=A0A8J7PHP2_9BACT|nr:UDP-N-acetylmuramoyl-L-alanine--D-glutamate ligase [Candidatus Obscuribacter phosphatis]